MDRIVLRKHQPYAGIIRGSSYITDIFPASGQIIDSIIYGLGKSKTIASIALRFEIAKLHSVKKFDKILVVADLNIGDAILTQSVISGIRDYLPEAIVDYLFASSAASLISRNPEISHEFPVLTGKPFPKQSDVEIINRIVKENGYDIIINFCPLFNGRTYFGKVIAIEGYECVGPQILHDENDPYSVNHVSYKSNTFVKELLSPFLPPVDNRRFKGVTINVSEKDYSRAREIIEETRHNQNKKPVILYNPDASSPFTAIPVEYQTNLVHKLAMLDCNIILCSGYTLKDIEKRILNSIPAWLSERITILPTSVSLTELAALADFCDIYLGGDTGPLHIAAARKRSDKKDLKLRNKTAVFSIFGATPDRIYGYDSVQPGFLPAYQDAISRVYSAKSQCRNITCADKKNKICRVVRCFESLDINEIVSDISDYLNKTK